MTLFTYGVNHKVAPIEVREQWAFGKFQQKEFLQQLRAQSPVEEAVLLSTCNRTEFYCAGEDASSLISWLYRNNQLHDSKNSSLFYQHHNEAAVQHLLRVTNGLDSLALGENQILGQVKSAYEFAEKQGMVGRHLRRLFHYTFSVTKQIRTETEIGTNPISIAFIAVNLAKQIFSDLKQTNVLLVGSGQTIELVSHYLHDIPVKDIVIAGRSQSNANTLAERFGGKGIHLNQIPHVLGSMDLVISATASPLPIIGKGAIETALKQRKHRPMLLIDIASPRDIESEVGQLEDVYLYNLDDLAEIIRQGLNQRQMAASRADSMIDAYVEYFMCYLKSLDVNELILQYRDKVSECSKKDLQKALQNLKNGQNPEDVLYQFAYSLTNKLMHHPCTQIRQAGYQGEMDVLHYAKLLLGI